MGTINRLLRVMPLSTRRVMILLLARATHLGPGSLSLDDAVVEKAFAKQLPWAAWTSSFAK